MNFQFFESLTTAEARQFFESYLNLEARAIEHMVVPAQEEVYLDYSLGSLSSVLKWFLSKVETVRGVIDETLPSWIKEPACYKQGILDFDEQSKPLVMRASFYLGESFVRQYSCLFWAIGNSETIYQQMPVVSGFQSGLEMAPIVVIENLFLRVLGEDASVSVIDEAVEYWISLIPKKGRKLKQLE